MVNKDIILFLLCLLSPTSTRVEVWLRAVETTSIREALTRSGLRPRTVQKVCMCAFEYFVDIFKFSLVVCNVLWALTLHFFFLQMCNCLCAKKMIHRAMCRVQSSVRKRHPLESTLEQCSNRALTAQGLKDWRTYRASL